DTNHDGKLDAGDADFSKFKIMVTNADGMTTLETLAQAGIQSINLNPAGGHETLADGSAIVATTSYTKTDGSSGLAGDAKFAFDSNGYAVGQTKTANTDGSTTLDVKAYNKDGTEASETVRTSSADGQTIAIKFDDNGDGIFDRSQTDM